MKMKTSVIIFVFVLLAPLFGVQAGWNVDSLGYYGLPSSSVYDIVTNVLDWLLAIIGIVGIIGFLIAGGMYITAFGDEKKAGTAKSAMMNSIIGVIVALVGFIAIQAIDALLNAGFF